MALRTLALCAGIGGLELGIPNSRTVCYVERDAYAAHILMERMRDKTLADAPIWDDLATFDSAAWRGIVDCVTAGFPCQPFSVAGQRRGLDDARWIWPHIERIIRDLRPGYVFLENVPGLLTDSGGMGAVLGSLAALGFDAEWDVFSAAEIGAPHQRKRVFILGHAARPLERHKRKEHQTVLRGRKNEQARTRAAGDRRDFSARKDAIMADAAWLPGGERPRRQRILDDGAPLADAARIGERESDNPTRADARRRPRENPGGRSGNMVDAARGGASGRARRR